MFCQYILNRLNNEEIPNGKLACNQIKKSIFIEICIKVLNINTGKF